MATLRFLRKFCKQTAVYWGNPVNDGYGHMTFDNPIEIKCKWTDHNLLRLSEDGKETQQKAEILIMEPLQVEGYLYLGCLADIEQYYETNSSYINPMNVEGAYEITEAKQSPVFWHKDTYVYKVVVGFINILKSKKQYASRN